MAESKNISRRKFIKTLSLAAGAAALQWSGVQALAAQIKDKKSFPVVVVGAGLGGLVSAAYLAQTGFDVTIIEQHSIPGGYATAFDRGDFSFDVSLHATVAEHAQPQLILSELGLWDKIKLADTPEFKRIVSDRFDVTLPARNPDGVKKMLSSTFPAEEKGIHDFYGEMEQVLAEVYGTRGGGAPVMDRLEQMTLADWMAQHVSDSGVKSCLAAFSGYYGLPPEKINALFYAIATGEYLVRGGQYYRTRSQDLSTTLAEGIRSFGGRVQYNTRVDRILLDKNRAVKGVADTGGHMYRAKAVIANCPVPALIDHMLPAEAVPESFRNQARKRTVSASSFVVWLGLDGTVAHHIKDYEIDLLRNSPEKNSRPFVSGDPAGADLSVTIYDNLYPGYSVKGKTTMTIMCLADYQYWKKYEKDYFRGEKEAYRKEKERIADDFIRHTEIVLIPGLSNMIEEMEIGTPLTNMYYTGNPGGAIYGYDRDMTHLSSRTPIQGLYLSSAWSHGGGYTPVMIGGRETARLVLKAFKKAKI